MGTLPRVRRNLRIPSKCVGLRSMKTKKAVVVLVYCVLAPERDSKHRIREAPDRGESRFESNTTDIEARAARPRHDRATVRR